MHTLSNSGGTKISHRLLRVGLVACLTLGGVGLALAQTQICCQNTDILNNADDPPYGPCSIGVITSCVHGYVTDPNGQVRDELLSDPLCRTYEVTDPSHITPAPCTPHLGDEWANIGTLGNGQCCWIDLSIWLTSPPYQQTQTGYQVYFCQGDVCEEP